MQLRVSGRFVCIPSVRDAQAALVRVVAETDLSLFVRAPKYASERFRVHLAPKTLELLLSFVRLISLSYHEALHCSFE